jgi:hypothetical protein
MIDVVHFIVMLFNGENGVQNYKKNGVNNIDIPYIKTVFL